MSRPFPVARAVARRSRPGLVAALLLLAALAVTDPARADEYEGMLGYLADTRLDGRALSGARGTIAVNQAAGDLNQQANLRALAIGDAADAHAVVRQRRDGDGHDLPARASARIGGDALSGAGGLASINQASGSGNAESNAVTVRLAEQGIRETPDALLSASVSASAERRTAADPAAGRTSHREVAVESTALHGFEGVLQLNQIAGSGNETGNGFALSVQPGP